LANLEVVFILDSVIVSDFIVTSVVGQINTTGVAYHIIIAYLILSI